MTFWNVVAPGGEPSIFDMSPALTHDHSSFALRSGRTQRVGYSLKRRTSDLLIAPVITGNRTDPSRQAVCLPPDTRPRPDALRLAVLLRRALDTS